MVSVEAWLAQTNRAKYLLVCVLPLGVVPRMLVSSQLMLLLGSSSGKVYAVTGSSPIALSTEFEAHTSPISALDVHGTVLATAADSGEIKLWDTGSLKELVTFAGHGYVMRHRESLCCV